MPRWPVCASAVSAMALLAAVCGSIVTVESTLPPDEFWRLPWKAGVSHSVSGYGYGEGDTHSSGNDYWALDFQAAEGEYVVATQEGNVYDLIRTVTGCGPDLSYGNWVDLGDTGGYRHRYAHLSSVDVVRNQHVLPGQIIGRAGHTGNVDPCDPPNYGTHLHFRITDPNNSPCGLGYCIPEPMSGFCAGYPVSCRFPTPFSADPSTLDPALKSNPHLSNNAGVGYRPYAGSLPVTDDEVVDRYYDEGDVHNDWSERIVGKPTNPYGAGFYVHRWESFAGSGWVQDFDSPSSSFGAGAIMAGDTAQHNPADGRADIDAMWVYGKFWQEYIGQCVPWGGGPAVQYIHLLGYPTTEQYADGFGTVRQLFQHGSMYWHQPALDRERAGASGVRRYERRRRRPHGGVPGVLLLRQRSKRQQQRR